MRNMIKLPALASCLLLTAIPEAASAVQYVKYDFTGVFPSDAIIPKISGSFTLFYEDQYVKTPSLAALDLTFNGVVWTIRKVGSNLTNGKFQIGGEIGGSDAFNYLSTYTNDFAVFINPITPDYSYFFYTLKGWAGAGFSYGLDNTFTWKSSIVDRPPPIGSIPEPASWLMMIAGFGLVGSGLRRRSAMRPALTC